MSPNDNAMTRFTTRFALLFAVIALLAAHPAQADSYRVDLIVFLDTYASGEPGTAPQPAMMDGAIDLRDTAGLLAAGIRVLPDADFGLQEQWNRLRNARRFRPLLRLAWEQERPPAANAPRLAIRYGEPVTITDPLSYSSFLVAPVEGSVSLAMNRYLHLDVDLRYTQDDGAGAASQFALVERRRMRRNELHHLDSPRLGALARVQRLQ